MTFLQFTSVIDTFSRLSRHLLENLAFAEYLFPLCLVKFMFPNIPCGTSRNSGRPALLDAMFDDDRSPFHVLHFWSFRIAVNDKCSPRVVLISVRCFMSKQNIMLENFAFPDDLSSVFFIFSDCLIASLRNDSPVRSILRFRPYASTLSRLVSSAPESQK